MAYPGGGSSFSTGSSESTSSSGEARTRSVVLCRRPGVKLGFSIRGGKEHGTGFFVTAVEPHSEAAKQGLIVGDQIIRINGFPVEDATHKEVLQLILGQQATVTFKVKSVGMIPVKENPEDELSWQIVEPSMLLSNGHQTDIYKGDVCDDMMRCITDVKMVLRVPPRAKLGCGICKGPEWKPGVFVQFTKENSIARQAGLRPGDQIIQCNNFVFTTETPFNEAVSVMRCSGVLELLVRKGAGLELFPGESSGYNSSASSVAGDNPPRLSALPEECNGVSDSPVNGNHDIMKNGRQECQNGCSMGRTDYQNGRQTQHNGRQEYSNERMDHHNGNQDHHNGRQDHHNGRLDHHNGRQDHHNGRLDQHNGRLDQHNGRPDHHNGRQDHLNGRQDHLNGRKEYPNGCTIIHVSGDEPDNNNKKIAEICMVSQQLETKTTTVFVEVHHSEDDSVSNAQSEASTDRLTNSSSVSSFTSSASSLSSAINQEIERRSKLQKSPGKESPLRPLKQTDKLIKNGLAKEKVEQHEQLMLEFKKAHRKMFSSDSDSTIQEEREEQRLPELKNEPQSIDNNTNNAKDPERTKSKRQTAPPPPPPLPDEKTADTPKPDKPKALPSKKHAPPPPPPSPPYCPTPDYDTASIASEKGKKGDIVDMQSLESFKLTNPSTVKPKPPNNYFPKGLDSINGFSSCSTASTMALREGSKPLVTIREYPGGKERKNPTKFDFLQNISPPTNCGDEPISCRLQNELSQTLSRAAKLTKSEECSAESLHNQMNGNSQKGTVVTINGPSQGKTETSKPFYLFPNGSPLNGVDSKKLSSLITSAANKNSLVNGKTKANGQESPPKNSVTFNFSNKTQESRNGHGQKNGILKNGNSNISQVQIQTQMASDKVSSQKSIKFGGM